MVRTRSGLDTAPVTTTPTPKTYKCVREAFLDVDFKEFEYSLDEETMSKMLTKYFNQRTYFYSDGLCTNFSYRDACMTVARYMNPSMPKGEEYKPKTYMPYYFVLMDYQYERETKEFVALCNYMDNYFTTTTPTLDRLVVD